MSRRAGLLMQWACQAKVKILGKEPDTPCHGCQQPLAGQGGGNFARTTPDNHNLHDKHCAASFHHNMHLETFQPSKNDG